MKLSTQESNIFYFPIIQKQQIFNIKKETQDTSFPKKSKLTINLLKWKQISRIDSFRFIVPRKARKQSSIFNDRRLSI